MPIFFYKIEIMLNNRIDSTEIIKIADAVADEKSIDKNLVLKFNGDSYRESS